ncbi:MAG TPA: hypothetical protein VFO28_02910 [Burkholderiaceae bacterium]|nr:hypothetical protein [Burkholderiaceae bacterium]
MDAEVRDQWLYRDVEDRTRRVVLRARCVDYDRGLWSCDVFVLTHDPARDDEGGACSELHHQHLMATFESANAAHRQGLEAGLAWIATTRGGTAAS